MTDSEKIIERARITRQNHLDLIGMGIVPDSISNLSCLTHLELGGYPEVLNDR